MSTERREGVGRSGGKVRVTFSHFSINCVCVCEMEGGGGGCTCVYMLRVYMCA